LELHRQVLWFLSVPWFLQQTPPKYFLEEERYILVLL